MLRAITFAFASIALIPFFAACSAATASDPADGEIPGTRISDEALKGGCHVICPKCHPGQICPKYACHIECPPKTTPCGTGVCTGGQVCCNDSCGICTDPGGFCTEQFCQPTGCVQTALCIIGYTWDSKACQCVPAAGECTTDADCHLEDNYCGGCNCLALANGEAAPTCTNPVQCFAAPCAVTSGVAACVNGQCTLANQ